MLKTAVEIAIYMKDEFSIVGYSFVFFRSLGEYENLERGLMSLKGKCTFIQNTPQLQEMKEKL